MLVNSFLLFNEIEHLRLRLEYEYSFYDRFLIVEGTKTFAGKPKILYFEKYKHLFTKFLDKIHYEVIDDFPEVIKSSYIGLDGKIAPEFRWHLEGYSRECVQKGLVKMGLSDNDLVVYCDVDEVVNVDKLKEAVNNINDSEVHRFELVHYEYSVALQPVSEQWIGPFLTKFKYLNRIHSLGLLRALSIPASNARLLKYYVKTSLGKILVSFVNPLSLKLTSREVSASVAPDSIYQNEGEAAKNLMNNGMPYPPTDIELREVGIKKAIFHASSGWHFSYMTGGFKEYFLLKVQNFSHAELSIGERLDTQNDYYELQQNYILKTKDEGMYGFENLDSRIPDFVRENIEQLCFLLLPKHTDSFQIKDVSQEIR